MLVKRCLCGIPVDLSFKDSVIHKIPVLRCPDCGVLHQRLDITNKEYQEFYETEYHIDHQQNLGQQQYDVRYTHDKEVAEQRMTKYDVWLKGTKLLDIGASNGAFIDVAADYGMDAWGLDLNEDLIKHPKMHYGPLATHRFDDQEFDNITMHDVLEHIVDPAKELEEIRRVLALQGVLIVDIPDYFDPSGVHHWRPTEHLWFFTKGECERLLENNGFQVKFIDKPISSKLVYYTVKK